MAQGLTTFVVRSANLSCFLVAVSPRSVVAFPRTGRAFSPPIWDLRRSREDRGRTAARGGRGRPRGDRRRAPCNASAIRGDSPSAASGSTELTDGESRHPDVATELERDPVYVVRTPAFAGPTEPL